MIVDFIDGEYVERHDEPSDLFALLRQGRCEYGEPGTCDRPATHAVFGRTDSGPHAGDLARRDCCLDHANYYARGWLQPQLLYPGVRGAVWIEPLEQRVAA